MAQPLPSLTYELGLVTGDQVTDLRPLSQATWFIFNPAGVNTTAITDDPIGYVAYGKQYFGVTVDWAAVDRWESTADLIDGITNAMLSGVRGAEDVRTLDALFNAVTELTDFLAERGPQFESWVQIASTTDSGLGGSAVTLIKNMVERYHVTIDNWQGTLAPLPNAVDQARILLRRFNSDVAGAWNDVQSQGLRTNIRAEIDKQIAAIQAHLVAGGIVLGAPGYLFADWDPTAQSTLPVTQADLDAFSARVEAQILATLSSFPAGNLQSAGTWAAINQAITATVTPLIDRVSAIANERRLALENGYTGLTNTLIPLSPIGVRADGHNTQKQGPDGNPDGNPDGDSSGSDGQSTGGGSGTGPGAGSGGPGGIPDPVLNAPDVGAFGTANGGATFGGAGGVGSFGDADGVGSFGDVGGVASFGIAGGGGDPANAGFGTNAPGLSGAGNVDLGLGPIGATGPGLLDEFSASGLVDPAIDGTGQAPPFAFGSPLLLSGLAQGGGSGATARASTNASSAGGEDLEEQTAGEDLTEDEFAADGFTGQDSEGLAGASLLLPRVSSATVVPPGLPSLSPAVAADPTLSHTFATRALPAWDGRVGGDGLAGVPRTAETVVMPVSPTSAYRTPGFWPAGLYGSSPTQFAGSPVAYGTNLVGPGLAADARLTERVLRERFPYRASVAGPAIPSRSDLRPPDPRGGPQLVGDPVESNDEEDQSWSRHSSTPRPDGVVGPVEDHERPDTFASLALVGTASLIGARRPDDEEDDEYRDQPRRGPADGVIDGSE